MAAGIRVHMNSLVFYAVVPASADAPQNVIVFQLRCVHSSQRKPKLKINAMKFIITITFYARTGQMESWPNRHHTSNESKVVFCVMSKRRILPPPPLQQQPLFSVSATIIRMGAHRTRKCKLFFGTAKKGQSTFFVEFTFFVLLYGR